MGQVYAWTLEWMGLTSGFADIRVTFYLRHFVGFLIDCDKGLAFEL